MQTPSSIAKPTASTQAAPCGPALPQSLAECHAVIKVQAELLTTLQAQVQLLEERVNLNSRNSSKPPSSDGPGSGNRAQRRASQRKRGAQPGHKGHSRAMLDEAELDSIVDCKPGPVCECGAAVAVAADEPRRHQVFDIPPLRARVDEYRLYSGRCQGCGRAHAGVLPPGVPKGQLGPRALSLVGVLGTRYHLTQRKIRNLLDQLMGLSFSVGAISQAHGKVAGALKAPVAQAAASLSTAPALWMDETHYPREGSANWVWAAVQPLMAVFAIYPTRARYVIPDLIGGDCTAVVTTDRYAAYAFIDAERRQVCWAHLLRDFNRIGQRAGLAGRIGRRLQGLGLVMFRRRQAARLQGPALDGLQRRLRAALELGAQQLMCPRTAKTCANVLKLWPALWSFTPTRCCNPPTTRPSRRCAAWCSSARSRGPRAACAVTSSLPGASAFMKPACDRVWICGASCTGRSSPSSTRPPRQACCLRQ